MKRKKQEIQHFINWLQNYGSLPYIKIRVIYKAPVLKCGGVDCFGVFMTNGERTKAEAIYVAGGKWPKSVVMQTIAHEWAHYLHFETGLPDCEESADEYAFRALHNYRLYCHLKKHRLPVGKPGCFKHSEYGTRLSPEYYKRSIQNEPCTADSTSSC